MRSFVCEQVEERESNEAPAPPPPPPRAMTPAARAATRKVLEDAIAGHAAAAAALESELDALRAKLKPLLERESALARELYVARAQEDAARGRLAIGMRRDAELGGVWDARNAIQRALDTLNNGAMTPRAVARGERMMRAIRDDLPTIAMELNYRPRLAALFVELGLELPAAARE